MHPAKASPLAMLTVAPAMNSLRTRESPQGYGRQNVEAGHFRINDDRQGHAPNSLLGNNASPSL